MLESARFSRLEGTFSAPVTNHDSGAYAYALYTTEDSNVGTPADTEYLQFNADINCSFSASPSDYAGNYGTSACIYINQSEFIQIYGQVTAENHESAIRLIDSDEIRFLASGGGYDDDPPIEIRNTTGSGIYISSYADSMNEFQGIYYQGNWELKDTNAGYGVDIVSSQNCQFNGVVFVQYGPGGGIRITDSSSIGFYEFVEVDTNNGIGLSIANSDMVYAEYGVEADYNENYGIFIDCCAETGNQLSGVDAMDNSSTDVVNNDENTNVYENPEGSIVTCEGYNIWADAEGTPASCLNTGDFYDPGDDTLYGGLKDYIDWLGLEKDGYTSSASNSDHVLVEDDVDYITMSFYYDSGPNGYGEGGVGYGDDEPLDVNVEVTGPGGLTFEIYNDEDSMVASGEAGDWVIFENGINQYYHIVVTYGWETGSYTIDVWVSEQF